MIVVGTIELDGKPHSMDKTTRGRGGREGFTVEHLKRYITMVLKRRANKLDVLFDEGKITWSVK